LPKSTRDDAHAISTGIAIIGRVKRLLKIADQMQPELERDHPFARIVTLVGKLDIDAVPLGVCSYRCREPVEGTIHSRPPE
jgi:hypothetical protein